MKKGFSIKIILISAICLIIAGAITAFAIENPNFNQVSPIDQYALNPNDNKVPPPHQYNDYPEPLFKANKDVEGVTFKSKEEILKIINEHRAEDTGSSVKSIVMKTYGEYESEDDPTGGHSFEIDPDRIVWVVIEDYPNGIDTKGGFYDKATVTTVYDAQTGRWFAFGVTGICTDSGFSRILKKRLDKR